MHATELSRIVFRTIKNKAIAIQLVESYRQFETTLEAQLQYRINQNYPCTARCRILPSVTQTLAPHREKHFNNINNNIPVDCVVRAEKSVGVIIIIFFFDTLTTTQTSQGTAIEISHASWLTNELSLTHQLYVLLRQRIRLHVGNLFFPLLTMSTKYQKSFYSQVLLFILLFISYCFNTSSVFSFCLYFQIKIRTTATYQKLVNKNN